MLKRWIIGGIWAVLMSAGLLLCGRNAAAEQPTKSEKIVISDVIISGNQRITTEQIKAHLRTQPGKAFDSVVVDDDVRELYKTGQFSNIVILPQPDGIGRVKMYFSVREMPNTVQKITFRGAKHIKQDELLNLTGVRPNAPLNPTLNRLGCKRILEKYAEEGRALSDCRLIKGGDLADTEVIYQITEGPKDKVHDIQFEGNTVASTPRLRQKIPLQVGGTYKQKRAEASVNALYTFYSDLGFQDVRISLEFKRGSTPGEVTLIYHIHEGPRSRSADKSHE